MNSVSKPFTRLYLHTRLTEGPHFRQRFSTEISRYRDF